MLKHAASSSSRTLLLLNLKQDSILLKHDPLGPFSYLFGNRV
jgi:hypothetical protein